MIPSYTHAATERCDRLCVDLNRAIPVRNLVGELKWYGGCRCSRDRERGTLTIYQQSFAEEFKKLRVTSVQSVSLRVGVKLEEFNEDEETESWAIREHVGGLM